MRVKKFLGRIPGEFDGGWRTGHMQRFTAVDPIVTNKKTVRPGFPSRTVLEHCQAEPGPPLGGDFGGDFFEPGVSSGTDRTNGCDAHDDDQGEHDRVLNCGWAIFALQELLD